VIGAFIYIFKIYIRFANKIINILLDSFKYLDGFAVFFYL